MKKIILRFAVLLLALTFIAPSALSVVSFAADTSATETDLWTSTYDPAYTSSAFYTVEERLAGDTVISPMELVMVSNGYALYTDKLTGEVVCLKLASPNEKGEYEKDENGIYKYVGYYATNPYSLGHSGVLAAGAIAPTASSTSVKRTLLSQLLVKYTENTTTSTLESYTSAAMYDQITMKTIRGGLRVDYTIGREETTYLVPRQIRFDKWMNLLVQIAENSTTAKDKRSFAAYYTLKATSTEQLTSWRETVDTSAMSAATYEYLFITRQNYYEKYKGTSNENSFSIFAGVYSGYLEQIATKSDKTITEAISTYPCIKNFAIMVFDGTSKAAEIRKVEQFVKLYTDYTKEQMEEDHAETEYTGSDQIPALFKMSIEYTLDEDGLKIRISAGNIRFDSSSYTLQSITVLPYAGACDVNNGGYIVTPDGSGTIFDVSTLNGKQFTTTSTIYGQDYAYHTITGSNKEVTRFPIYGAIETVTRTEEYEETEIVVDAKTGEEVEQTVTKTRKTPTDYGYLAVITSGDSLAKLTVSNGGSLHMYTTAYTTFNPRPSDTYTLEGGISAGSNAMWTVESKRRYTGDYTIRIFILGGDVEASYSGMATVYRNYLQKQGILTALDSSADISNNATDIPLYIKTLGALETTGTFLGIPVTETVALTSFQKTIDMLEKLQKEGNINNVKVVMEGWCNDGLWPTVPNSIDICDELGGEEDFVKLVEYAKTRKNVELFPDIDLAFAIKDELFDGFDSDDVAKTIDDQNAKEKYYNAIYQGYGSTGRGVISPNSMEKIYESGYEDYKVYNVGGIAVSTLGTTLTTDFNEDDPLNREDSKKIIKRLLNTIKQNNGNVLVRAGNSYTWEYVSDIIDVPVDDSRYSYTSASIPLYGMIIHGSIEYSGTSINLAGDYRYHLLKSIESGASPQFVIAIDNTAELKQYATDPTVSEYFAVKYSIWLSSMVETYNEMNEALKSVKYSYIVKHEFVNDNYKVVKVTYDNGDAFYINYLEKDVTVVINGTKTVIPANDFVKVHE